MKGVPHSHVVFECDQCGDEDRFGGVSFRNAVLAAKNKGWRIEYPRDNPDVCPKCVMDRISKAARQT